MSELATAPSRPPAPVPSRVAVGSVLLVLGGSTLCLGALLWWYRAEVVAVLAQPELGRPLQMRVVTVNGFDDPIPRSTVVAHGAAFMFLGVVLAACGVVHAIARHRRWWRARTAVPVLAVVVAAGAVVLVLAGLSDLADTVAALDAHQGPGLWVALAGGAVAIAGAAAALAERR